MEPAINKENQKAKNVYVNMKIRCHAVKCLCNTTDHGLRAAVNQLR